jgi:putative ABC transport system substrate-binding protein
VRIDPSNRREFLALLGVAAGWPIVARTQPATIPVVGFLNATSPSPWKPYVEAFRQGLNEAGFVEGRTVVIEYRWAEGQYERLPSLAADLVRRQVAVIVSTGGAAPILAAKAATTKIPIVFTTGSDPVRLGLVASLNRPGGNITGVNLFVTQMASKRLGLLRELVPTAAMVAVLSNPTNPSTEDQLKDVQEAARAMGQQIHILSASTDQELDAAFRRMTELGAGALLVAADPYFTSRRSYVIALAVRHSIPAIYEQREHAMAGGLMSYGTSLPDGYRQVGRYTGRILKGEKPADLPVMQPTKFEFVINLTAAKVLGLEVPPTLLARTDEAIE